MVDQNVTTVAWHPSVIKPLTLNESTDPSRYSTLAHVPEARADIMWDGSDATYIDTGPPIDDPGWSANWHVDALQPTQPIPEGSPQWVRLHLRMSSHSEWWYTPDWHVAFEAAHSTDEDYRAVAAAPYPFAPGEITQITYTMHRHSGSNTSTDGYGFQENLDLFAHDYPWTVAVTAGGSPLVVGGRLYEFWVEVGYEPEPEPEPNVTIVPWYPSVAKPRDVWGSAGATSALTHTPEARADILWDFSDESFIDSGVNPGGDWTGEWHADTLTPSQPIPRGRALWARAHVRVSGHGSAPFGWVVSLATWVDNVVTGTNQNFADLDLWADGLYDLTAADGIVSDEVTLTREVWGDALGMFERGYPWLVTVPEADPPTTDGGRFYEMWWEVAYEGTPDYPLRQLQRDDHLAAGSPRATAGTSRQGSIRARGYE